MSTVFNPDSYVTSFFRSLKNYLDVGGAGGQPPGLDLNVYELVDSYPGSDELSAKLPLAKTIIHMEIEDIGYVPFGFGENIVNKVYNEPAFLVEEWEAHCRDVTLDIGVWASVESGGPTARMRVREHLDSLLVGPTAYEQCMSVTVGIHLLDFTGGRNLIDTIGDIKVFRTVDLSLRCRVFSRRKKLPVTFIEKTAQIPDLTIDGSVHIIG